jgi:hypothetical protein
VCLERIRNVRKISPSTTCLYSAASMLLRSLSAASQSLASKPMVAVEPLPFARESVLVFVRAMDQGRALTADDVKRVPG